MGRFQILAYIKEEVCIAKHKTKFNFILILYTAIFHDNLHHKIMEFSVILLTLLTLQILALVVRSFLTIETSVGQSILENESVVSKATGKTVTFQLGVEL